MGPTEVTLKNLVAVSQNHVHHPESPGISPVPGTLQSFWGYGGRVTIFETQTSVGMLLQQPKLLVRFSYCMVTPLPVSHTARIMIFLGPGNPY